MSQMRSIVTLLVSFAFMGLFSLLSRGARLQQSRLEQSTYKVSGRMIRELSVITIIDSESIEMIDRRGPNVCVAISTIGVQSRFQGSLHPGRVNAKQG